MDPIRATVVEDIDAAADTPGAIEFAADDAGLFYVCPCGCRALGYLPFHHQGTRSPHWQWNGSKAIPSLRPSVHHRIGKPGLRAHDPDNPEHWDTHWHGSLMKGQWVERVKA